MTVLALTNFLTITTASGAVEHRFQNGLYDGLVSDGSKLPDSSPYKYLSFIYQGAAKNRSGDNLEASLVLANSGSREVPTAMSNKLSMNYAKESVENKWLIEVTTCLMNATFDTVQTVLTNEKWLAATMSYDAETIEVILSSAIDAVGANCPTRVLTSEQVGHLPVTGQMQSR